jgi:hypothetical protein
VHGMVRKPRRSGVRAEHVRHHLKVNPLAKDAPH